MASHYRYIGDEPVVVLLGGTARTVEPDEVVEAVGGVYFQTGEHGEPPLWEAVTVKRGATRKATTTTDEE